MSDNKNNKHLQDVTSKAWLDWYDKMDKIRKKSGRITVQGWGHNPGAAWPGISKIWSMKKKK